MNHFTQVEIGGRSYFKSGVIYQIEPSDRNGSQLEFWFGPSNLHRPRESSMSLIGAF